MASRRHEGYPRAATADGDRDRFCRYAPGPRGPALSSKTVAMGQLRRLVAVNEFGRRIGETHHNAIISDAMVDQIRSAHEDSRRGYLEISMEFDIALTTVRKICTYERRAQTPERWKTIRK